MGRNVKSREGVVLAVCWAQGRDQVEPQKQMK